MPLPGLSKRLQRRVYFQAQRAEGEDAPSLLVLSATVQASTLG